MWISSCVAALALIVATASLVAAPKFRSVWKAPEVSRLNFIGKQVAAVVIADDQSLQISAEEALTRELNARGAKGLATYRFVPREELKTAERARPWFERAGAQAVVALRPISRDKSLGTKRVAWAGYYHEFWSYYGYGWQSATPIAPKETTIVVVETLIYDLGRNRLVWAATSETNNPKNVQSFISDLIGGVIREMKKMKMLAS